MFDIQIIPKGRDYKAKVNYKFMNWFLRVHRKDLQEKLEEEVVNLFLYGEKSEKHG